LRTRPRNTRERLGRQGGDHWLAASGEGLRDVPDRAMAGLRKVGFETAHFSGLSSDMINEIDTTRIERVLVTEGGMCAAVERDLGGEETHVSLTQTCCGFPPSSFAFEMPEEEGDGTRYGTLKSVRITSEPDGGPTTAKAEIVTPDGEVHEERFGMSGDEACGLLLTRWPGRYCAELAARTAGREASGDGSVVGVWRSALEARRDRAERLAAGEADGRYRTSGDIAGVWR